mgnify:CR=1 FL=1
MKQLQLILPATTLVLFGLLTSSYAQNVDLKTYGRYDSVSVKAFGTEYAFPWVGGLNTPQFSDIDLNGDGIDDLFIFDRDGQCVRTFINQGKKDTIGYDYSFDYEIGFPKMTDFALLRDFDGDGKKDIFSAVPNFGDIKVFKNTSTGPAPNDFSFLPIKYNSPFKAGQYVDFITYKYYPPQGGFIYTDVYNGFTDIPGITDIDGDGDMDILAFGSGANSITYYKNLSQENNGNNDSLIFDLESTCWGHFIEDAFSFQLYFGSCKGGAIPLNKSNPISNGRGSRHEGSTILIQDMDGNDLPDLILGDISYNNLLMAYNNGTLADARLTSQDTAYPRNNTSVDVQTFPAAYYVDVDNDGVKDLIASPNAEAGFDNINGAQLYKNNGSNNNASLQYQGNDFLFKDMIDLGTNAHPLLIDVDGDSLNDLLVGNRGVFSRIGTYESRIAYYKNTGTKTDPAYTLITRDYLLLPSAFDTGLCPAAGDLDNDGDIDLLIGTESGKLYYYENQASNPSDSCLFSLKTTPFSNRVFGNEIRPALFDVNKDGKLDLIVGSQTPELVLYENVGTTSAPDFDPSITTSRTNGFAGVYSEKYRNGYLSPFMISLDSNGAIDQQNGKDYLFVGTGSGYLYMVTDIDPSSRTSAGTVDSIFLYTSNVSLAGSDITGDGKSDVIFGHKTGGLSILLKDGGNIIKQPPAEPEDTLNVDVESTKLDPKIKAFPNPTTNTVTLNGLDNDEVTHAQLFDIEGKLVWENYNVRNDEPMNLEGIQTGIYFLQVESASISEIVKIVKH